MDDREWNDPSPERDLEPRVLALRLACAGIVLFVLVVLTRGFLVEAIPLLWPPTEPIGQWSMLVILHAFGYILVPLMIGSAIADLLLTRVLETAT